MSYAEIEAGRLYREELLRQLRDVGSALGFVPPACHDWALVAQEAGISVRKLIGLED